MGYHVQSWPDERTEALKKLAAEGLLSASEMGAVLGIGRNAVIGKIHREKFEWNCENRACPQKGPRRPRTRSNNPKLAKARRGPASAERESTLQSIFRQAGEATDLSPEKRESRNVGFFELADHQCKWPSGDPSMIYALRFCGANRVELLPYCLAHCRIAYRSEKEVQRLEVWWGKRAQRWVAA